MVTSSSITPSARAASKSDLTSTVTAKRDSSASGGRRPDSEPGLYEPTT